MPPRRKKSQKNDLDRINSLASKLGINVDNLLEQVPLTEVGAEAVVRYELEAESVLFFIETKGKDFQQSICKAAPCGRAFMHTYLSVAYCSDNCRAWALSEYGLIWNFHRRTLSQRWNVKGKGFIPKIIGVEATAALIEAGYAKLEVEEMEPVESEVTYTPEAPYDPNFKLENLKDHSDDNTNEIEELKAKLKELENG